MANISKQNGRKLVEEQTACWTGSGITWSPKPDEPGMMTGADEYTLTIGKHVAHLSEQEMLDAVMEWMQTFNDQRKRKAFRDAVKRYP